MYSVYWQGFFVYMYKVANGSVSVKVAGAAVQLH